MPATAKLISERVSANALAGVQTADVDEEHGVIRGVVVCGLDSANGRRYPNETMARDFKKYEGVSVNFDHLDGSGSRRFDDRGGWLNNLRIGNDGRPRADMNVLKSDSRSAKVFELARRNPNAFGLSHVAHCQTRFDGGVEVVEAIDEVISVDIVADPATNKGLFENRRQTVAKKTFREVLEGLRSHAKYDAAKKSRIRKLLLASEEDAGMSPVMDAQVDEPEAESDPDKALVAGFKAAIDAAWEKYTGDMDSGTFLKTVGKYIKAHAKLTASNGGDGGGDDEPPSEEGRKKVETDLTEAVLAELEAAGVPAKGGLVRTLRRLTDKADRDVVIAEAKSNTGGQYMSQGREQFADKKAESSKGAIPTGPKPLSEDWID